MIHLTPSHMALRERAIATLFIVAVSVISIVLYDNRKSTYTAGKTMKLSSAWMFVYLHRYIQLSTIVFALGGCLFYDRVFLDLHDSTLIFYSGLVVAASGIGLFTFAKLTRAANYSLCFDAYRPNSRTTTGPYRYIRQPIYVSNLLILIGAFVMSGSFWIVPNIPLAAYFYATSAIREERELSQKMVRYTAYQKLTGRFFPRFLGIARVARVPH